MSFPWVCPLPLAIWLNGGCNIARLPPFPRDKLNIFTLHRISELLFCLFESSFTKFSCILFQLGNVVSRVGQQHMEVDDADDGFPLQGDNPDPAFIPDRVLFHTRHLRIGTVDINSSREIVLTKDFLSFEFTGKSTLLFTSLLGKSPPPPQLSCTN